MADLESIEKDQNARIVDLVERDAEWEVRTNQLFAEIQQNEILQEKKAYEKAVRMDDMVQLIKEQQEQIGERDE